VSDTPSADIRIGYARCSTLTQELQSQLDTLAAHGIPRDKIFSEKISTRVRVRPQFEAALALARQIKAHAPHCRVILTVNEMKRLGRDAAELTALADHLTAHGLVLEMLAGPLPGIYDPSGPGRILFAFFAAMAETERENIREATLEGLDAAARKDKHGGRPAVSPHNTSSTCPARTNGRNCAPRRYTIRAFAPGPYCSRPATPSGASPQVITPHPPHTSDWTRYSVTCGLGGGGTSTTCRRCDANTSTPARSPAHPPQPAGRHVIRSSGSSVSIRVAPGAPRGLPRRPDPDPDLHCRSNPSDDGGFELFDESIPNRRRNSATSASNAATTASCSTIRATRSSYDGRCDSEPDTRALCHTNHTTMVKGQRP
jgi:DNA invertase Pin-like site-specific DNA recombinase